MNSIEQKSLFFRALGDPVRLRIVELLFHGKCTCICDIASSVGKDQSVVFRHVQLLAQAGIVKTSKDGKYLRCCIAEPDRMKLLLNQR